MKFIIKPFSEIMIKSKPVRRKTLVMLKNNIHLRIKKISNNLKVNLFYDKLEVNIIDFSIERDFEISEIKRALSRIPGIESFIEVEFHETNDFDIIVQKVSDRYDHVITIHKNPENHTQKATILKGYYDGHLINMLPKIEDIELVKVFGIEIAEKYRIHTTNRSSKMWNDSESEINDMMKSYKEEMFNLIQLKDILLPFCDELVISRDEQLDENYRLIRETYLNE